MRQPALLAELPSGQSHRDGVQGQAHARSHDGAVDPDVLQVAPEEQL